MQSSNQRLELSSAAPLVVGISGASCSGKSWLAESLHKLMPEDALILNLDRYYRHINEVVLLEHGHDNPDSVDLVRACNDLKCLKACQTIELPEYDFEQHRVTQMQVCEPKPLILVDGLFAFFHEPLRNELDLRIWMESDDELRLKRRLDRDSKCRQRTSEEIHSRYTRDVLPGYVKFIEPMRKYADVWIRNDDNDCFALEGIVDLVLTTARRRQSE